VERYKARLVAKGFTQKEGIKYKETFSHVSTKDSFRIIMALVAHLDLELHQMDVKTAFLNGEIDEIIYMVQPPHFETGDPKRMVCQLKKIPFMDSNKRLGNGISNSHMLLSHLVLRQIRLTNAYIISSVGVKSCF
jgi:Reverse transcriptase (RNA-dependent DNA polymerase)